MATKVTKKNVKKAAIKKPSKIEVLDTIEDTSESIIADLLTDSKLRGNYPYAVLHTFKTEGIVKASELAITLCKDDKKLTKKEAAKYVEACVKTRGQPHLLDLFEGEI